MKQVCVTFGDGRLAERGKANTVAQSYLACTVRGCRLPLERLERVVTCPAGHSYDVARSGYLNLLQPQDRRSLRAGDSTAAVEARAHLLAAGIGRAALDAIVQRVTGLDLAQDPVAADLGSGTGDLLAALTRARPMTFVGIDLSTAAVEHAARRFPRLTWVVANADRRLPLVDRSVHVVLSLHARRNPAECARVLSPASFLLMAVPAADDLHQLRALVSEPGGGPRHATPAAGRERGDALIAEHAHYFTMVERLTVREEHRLEQDALAGLLRSTYRGERRRAAERLKMVDRLDVTLASEIVLFKRR